MNCLSSSLLLASAALLALLAHRVTSVVAFVFLPQILGGGGDLGMVLYNSMNAD